MLRNLIPKSAGGSVGDVAHLEVATRSREVFGETLLRATVEKFRASDFAEAGLLTPQGRGLLVAARLAGIEPYEVVEGSPFNLLLYGGASNLWQCLIGNGTGTPGQSLTWFDNTNAEIGVGNSATAAAATQTDLQGASKFRQPMEATFPTHSDGVGSGAEDIVFKSSYATGDANYAWEEWGLFNANSGSRMLQRKVESLGTKTSAAIWTLTATLTLA